MLPRSRLLLVAVPLLGGVLLFLWLRSADVAVPPTANKAVATAANEAVEAAAKAPPAAAGAPSPAAIGAATEPGVDLPREELEAEPRSIRGIVVDASGTAVADARISHLLSHADMSTFITMDTTGVDGSFTLERAEDMRDSHIEVIAIHEQFDIVRQWLRWGRDDVRVVLRPRVPIEVRVVGMKGEPVLVAGVTTSWSRDGANEVVQLERRGDAWCGSVRRGISEILVSLATHQRVTRHRVMIADPGPVRVRLVALATASREVQVVDPDGRPVAGATVEVIRAPGAAVAAEPAVDAWVSVGPFGVRLATTDSAGLVRLSGPVGRLLVARATRTGYAPGLVDVRMPGDDPVVVRLGHAASGNGRVLADPRLAQRIAGGGCRLSLMQAEDSTWWPEEKLPHKAGIDLGADGSFAFAGAPPGNWQVRLWLPLGLAADAPAEPRGMGQQRARDDCRVALMLRPGDNPDLVVDMRAQRWTEVHLRILIDRKPASDGFAYISDLATETTVRAIVHLDEEGRGTTALRPGTYLLSLGSKWQSPRELARTVLEVAGEHVERELRLGEGGLAVTLVNGHGEPVLGLHCAAVPTADLDTWSGWSTADGDGVLRGRYQAGDWAVIAWSLDLDSVDLERSDLQQTLARARRVLGTVTVRAGATTTAKFVVPDDVPR